MCPPGVATTEGRHCAVQTHNRTGLLLTRTAKRDVADTTGVPKGAADGSPCPPLQGGRHIGLPPIIKLSHIKGAGLCARPQTKNGKR